MAVWLDVVLSILPIVILIFLMVKKDGVESYKALPAMALLLYLERLIYFETDPNLTNAAVVEGLLTAFTPISIIWGAIFLFKTMDNSSSMDSIRAWLRSITDVNIGQLMIIGWAFIFLIEGSSGFGTPAALGAPLLVGLGFPLEKAALFTLMMDSISVPFGAVGMPTWFGMGSLNLTEDQMIEVGWKSAILNTVMGLIIPLVGLLFVASAKDVVKNLPFIYLSLISTLTPFLLLSFVSYEFPSIIGGMVGLIITVVLAKFKIGMLKREIFIPDYTPQIRRVPLIGRFFPPPESPEMELNYEFYSPSPAEDLPSDKSNGDLTNSKEDEPEPDIEYQSPSPSEKIPDKVFKKATKNNLSPIPIPRKPRMQGTLGAPEAPSGWHLVKAFFPLWGTVLLLLITRIQQLEVRALLQATEPSLTIHMGTLGEFKLSPALVFQLLDIFQTPTKWSHAVLFVPSLIPGGLISVISFFLFRMPRKKIKKTVKESFVQLQKPSIALFAAMAFVKLLTVGGDRSCALILGTNFGNALGSSWELVAFFLGALGAFFSGSNTVSNLMFSPIQHTTAVAQNLNLTTVLALQNSGGAVGSMICINNVVAVCSVLGLVKKEGYIIVRLAIPLIICGIIAMILSTIM